MRKTIFLVITFLLYCSAAHAAWNATFPADNELFSDTPAGLRANFAAIALGTDPALLITDAKVSPSAAINDTKLATITTAGKVNGAALTGLASIPSGAGKIPNANINTGTGAAQIVVLDGAAKFPPIDISQATGINASNITTGVLPTAQVPTLDAAKIGSGTFDVARIPTGTTANKVVVLDGSAKLPAVDGSALTGLSSVSYASNSQTATTLGQICNTTKTITSGKTVFVIATGYARTSVGNGTVGVDLKSGSTSLQTLTSVEIDSNRWVPWALSGVATGLSGSTTFSVNLTATGNTDQCGCGLTVLEF